MDKQATDAQTAGVVARPPLLFLAALLAGFILDRLLGSPFPVPAGGRFNWTTGGALIVLGLALMVTGIRNFLRAGTPVPTNQSTRVLVTDGVHGWTRNPIYLGMFIVYGGIAVAQQSLWTLILALPLAIAIRYGVVAREEAYLERRFGAAYQTYKSRVRRWL